MSKIWYCKTITLDVPKGAPLSYLIEQIEWIKKQKERTHDQL